MCYSKEKLSKRRLNVATQYALDHSEAIHLLNLAVMYRFGELEEGSIELKRRLTDKYYAHAVVYYTVVGVYSIMLEMYST